MNPEQRSQLPDAKVTHSEGGLQLEVEKLVSDMLQDQSSRMVSSDGCISSPNGPYC